jgi:hypothetical protein
MRGPNGGSESHRRTRPDSAPCGQPLVASMSMCFGAGPKLKLRTASQPPSRLTLDLGVRSIVRADLSGANQQSVQSKNRAEQDACGVACEHRRADTLPVQA